MNITEFVQLSAKEANEKLRSGLKDGKIDIKQFKELSASWLRHQGLILSDFGWNSQEDMDEMGAYQGEDGKWYLETEATGISKKDGSGKMVHSVVHLPVKAIAFSEKNAEVVRAYNSGAPAISMEMQDKINILTNMED